MGFYDRGRNDDQADSVKSPDVLYQEIQKLISSGSEKEAIGALEMFLAIYPEYALAHNDLGVLYYKDGDKERSLQHYQKAAELQPENITFQKNLADFYYVELGRVEEAMGIYVKVLSINPEDIETLLILGHICVAVEKVDDAKDFYNKVLEIEPWNADAREKLTALEQGGRRDDRDRRSEDGGQRSEVTGQRAEDGEKEKGTDGHALLNGVRTEKYLVSAIVSTYNSERFIRGCLEDLEAQTIADRVEIIVVNSGSEQNEEAIVKEFQQKYSNIKYIKTDERETVYAAWNRAIKIASGKYISNANTDDRHRKDAFEVMVKVLEVRPEVALVYADLIITEMENEVFESCTHAGYFRWLNWNRKDLLERCFIGSQPMWQRSVHNEYGYFDDSFVTSGDYEFWLRISQTNTFLHIPDLLGLYLKSPGSIEHSNRKREAEENKRTIEMYKAAHASGTIVRRLNTDSVKAAFVKEDLLKTGAPKELLESYENLCADAGPVFQEGFVGYAHTAGKPRSAQLLISIIILTHNQVEYTKKCIESIFTHTKEPFELIIVDNGSTDGTVEYLESEVRGRRAEVRIIKNKENLGFAAGNNQGMATARGDYILLMNNDIVVTPNWLGRMISCAERDSKIGIVGPMSNYVTVPQLIKEVTYNKTNLDGLNDFAADISNRYTGNAKQLLRVVGFCMLIKRAVINKIGGMDGRYGLGNFEDDDFSLRATLAGFESWMAEDCFIHHFGNRTFIGAKIDYRESVHKNWEIFKEKWGMSKNIPYGSYNFSDIVNKGFIPEEHYCPLPGTHSFTVYDEAGISESEDITRAKIEFKKKCKPDMVSIIIPLTGHPKHLKKCIENIKKHTPGAHEVIFIDKGCKAGTLKWVRQAVKRKPNYRLIKAGKEAGLGKCLNMGMEASSGEYIIFMRDHVIVADGWLDGMLKCINRADDVGIVGPMTSGKAAGIQCVPDSANVKIDHLEKYAVAFRERNRHRRVPSREIMGFCMLFRRNLVEHIGPFDEELERGSESDDYCLRAALEEYKNLIAGDVFVLCGDLPPQGNKRFFDHKWRDIDAKSHAGERLGVINAITDAEKLYQREEVEKAIVKVVAGLKYRPDEEAIYHRLAEMLIDCERFKEGLEAINSIPEDKGDNARTLELTGYCKAGMELHDEAAQYADRALSLNGSSAPTLNLMGVLAHRKGDNNASEDFFKKAIASDPGYGEACTNLGVLAWEAGRKEGALELLEKGFILSPTAEDSRTAYLSAISETAEFERAEGIFREAKALYPQNRRIAFLLIDILIRQEKYKSAMQDIREAIITFGINDAILSAAQAVFDRSDVGKIKDTGKRPSLSLCMIVKNEEGRLSRCLMSAIPVVDEIVIVDTGSTDRTKEIAKTFGAKVYDFEWTDDFSEARNLSLAKATGNWIFVLDADETISPLDYDRLTKIVKNNADNPMAYSITTRNYVKPTYVVGWTCNDGQYANEEGGTGWYPSAKVRLFTNDSRIQFENPVHEFLEPSLKKNGIKIRKSDIPVHHYGQLDMEKYIAKGDKYYRLGKKKLEEKGEDLESIIELAVQAGGEFGKHEEAVDLWKRVLKIDPGNIKAFVNMGGACLQLERYEAARTSSKMAMAINPGLKEAIVIYTTCEMLIGDAGKTIPTLEGLLKKVPEYPMALAILAAAYCIEGERKKGMEHIRNLTKMGFKCADYLHDLAQRLISTGKTDRAVSLLEFAVESGNGTGEIRSLLSELKG